MSQRSPPLLTQPPPSLLPVQSSLRLPPPPTTTHPWSTAMRRTHQLHNCSPSLPAKVRQCWENNNRSETNSRLIYKSHWMREMISPPRSAILCMSSHAGVRMSSLTTSQTPGDSEGAFHQMFVSITPSKRVR